VTLRRLCKLLLIPLALSLTVTYAIYARMGRASEEPEVAMTELVVAARALPARTVISAQDVTLVEVPVAFAGQGHLRRLEDAVGRITLVPLAAGEVLYEHKLATAGSAEDGLAFLLPSHLRAMSLRVDDETGVAGHLQPGDHVDVVAIMAAPGEPVRSRLVLEEVPVLAVGQEGGAGGGTVTGTSRVITIGVTPQEAVLLALCKEAGAVRLLLRPAVGAENKGDLEVTSEIFKEGYRAPMIFEVKTQVRLQVEVAAVASSAVHQLDPALGQPGSPVVVGEVAARARATLEELVRAGQAVVLARRDLITMNREEARFAFTGQVPIHDTRAGMRLLSWREYGLTVSITPVTYNRPYFDLQIRATADVLRMVPAEDGSLQPFVDRRLAEGTVRIDHTEMVTIGGLIRQEDLAQEGGHPRYCLPPELVAGLKPGFELVVLIFPSVDPR